MRLRWLLFLIVTVGAGLWAFSSGRDAAHLRADRLAAVNRGLSDENLRLRDELSGLRAYAREANVRLTAPDRFGGASADAVERSLLELLRAKLRAGVPAERLAEVINQTGVARACSDAVETAQFNVRTELSVSDFNAASLAGNRIVVTATGSATRDAAGREHPWFDPRQPVRVEFTHISGNTDTATGILPLQHSMVADDREYRFLLAPGPTSFIAITADICEFP